MSISRKKKVLFVITKSNWGGAQRYVFDLASSLAGEYDVTVALGGKGRLAEMLEAKSIRVIPIPDLVRDISLRREITSFMFLFKLFRQERPDVIHLNSSKAAGIGALAARFALVRHVVFTAHAWAWNEDRSPLARALIAVLHYATVLLAHRTICVSNAVYDQMAHFPFTKRRMRIVHPGITPFPRLGKQQARAQFVEHMPSLKERKDFPWLVILGELHPIKGHRFALEALARTSAHYPTLTTVLIGNGEAQDELAEYVKAHGLEDTVLFAGHIADAASLLPAFDLMLVPSLSEAFGYVVLEAGAAEVPVIATKVGGIPEILVAESGVLIPPADSDAIQEALTRSLSMPEDARTRALALRVRVTEHFTKERMVAETTDLYEDLLRN